MSEAQELWQLCCFATGLHTRSMNVCEGMQVMCCSYRSDLPLVTLYLPLPTTASCCLAWCGICHAARADYSLLQPIKTDYDLLLFLLLLQLLLV